MDIPVVWSPEAVDDLESIAEYISRDSEFYARAVVTKLIETSRRIGETPRLGRMVPELEEEHIRERFVYSYRLVYRVEEKNILVIAVMHGKRLLESISERFTP
jgi:addiction module RelE/StbE family toxin